MAKQIYEWVGPIGGNWAYWAKNARLIGKYIKAKEIPAATIGPVVGRTVAASKAVIDLGIKGGLKVAHLHFNNRIYLLNDAQWVEFSAGIIANAKTKLAKTKAIGFEEGIALGSIS